MRIDIRRWFVVLLTVIASHVRADELNSTNKSQFTLFNPTPTDLMRPWYTDRAGQSPYTIDAGHFEASLTAFQYGYFHRNSETLEQTTHGYAIAGIELKAGLLNNVDAEVSILPYEIVNTTVTDHTFSPITGLPRSDVFHDNRSGIGDLESRIKWNLWGNDGGPTALSVAGVVDFPTGTGDVNNEQYQGGVSVAFQAHLPYAFELRLHNNMISIADFDDHVLKREFSFENEISLSHQIVGNLEGYCVFNTYTFTTPDRPWNGTIGVGLNYRIRKNVELYARMDFGVQGTPFDYSPGVGISARF